MDYRGLGTPPCPAEGVLPASPGAAQGIWVPYGGQMTCLVRSGGGHKEGKAGISGETALCPGMVATARGSHVKL